MNCIGSQKHILINPNLTICSKYIITNERTRWDTQNLFSGPYLVIIHLSSEDCNNFENQMSRTVRVTYQVLIRLNFSCCPSYSLRHFSTSIEWSETLFHFEGVIWDIFPPRESDLRHFSTSTEWCHFSPFSSERWLFCQPLSQQLRSHPGCPSFKILTHCLQKMSPERAHTSWITVTGAWWWTLRACALIPSVLANSQGSSSAIVMEPKLLWSLFKICFPPM